MLAVEEQQKLDSVLVDLINGLLNDKCAGKPPARVLVTWLVQTWPRTLPRVRLVIQESESILAYSDTVGKCQSRQWANALLYLTCTDVLK